MRENAFYFGEALALQYHLALKRLEQAPEGPQKDVASATLLVIEDELLKYIASREVARKAIAAATKKEESVVGVLTISDIWDNKGVVLSEFGCSALASCILAVLKAKLGFKATTFLNIVFSKFGKKGGKSKC